MNFYPPFLGAGVRIKLTDEKEMIFDVSMGLTFYNRNYVGTQFGGSLYSMTDPFIMLILIQKLGRDYLVWDKSAAIKFKSPGRGKVFARFHITDDQLNDVFENTKDGKKYEPVYEVEVKDETGNVVAIVTKELWIKKKKENQCQGKGTGH